MRHKYSELECRNKCPGLTPAAQLSPTLSIPMVSLMSSSTSGQGRSVPPGLNYAAGSWEGFLLLVRTERPGELHNARPTPAVKLLFCCECARLEEREGGVGSDLEQTGAEPSPGRAASLMMPKQLSFRHFYKHSGILIRRKFNHLTNTNSIWF